MDDLPRDVVVRIARCVVSRDDRISLAVASRSVRDACVESCISTLWLCGDFCDDKEAADEQLLRYPAACRPETLVIYNAMPGAMLAALASALLPPEDMLRLSAVKRMCVMMNDNIDKYRSTVAAAAADSAGAHIPVSDLLPALCDVDVECRYHGFEPSTTQRRFDALCGFLDHRQVRSRVRNLDLAFASFDQASMRRLVGSMPCLESLVLSTPWHFTGAMDAACMLPTASMQRLKRWTVSATRFRLETPPMPMLSYLKVYGMSRSDLRALLAAAPDRYPRLDTVEVHDISDDGDRAPWPQTTAAASGIELRVSQLFYSRNPLLWSLPVGGAVRKIVVNGCQDARGAAPLPSTCIHLSCDSPDATIDALERVAQRVLPALEPRGALGGMRVTLALGATGSSSAISAEVQKRRRMLHLVSGPLSRAVGAASGGKGSLSIMLVRWRLDGDDVQAMAGGGVHSLGLEGCELSADAWATLGRSLPNLGRLWLNEEVGGGADATPCCEGIAIMTSSRVSAGLRSNLGVVLGNHGPGSFFLRERIQAALDGGSLCRFVKLL